MQVEADKETENIRFTVRNTESTRREKEWNQRD